MGDGFCGTFAGHSQRFCGIPKLQLRITEGKMERATGIEPAPPAWEPEGRQLLEILKRKMGIRWRRFLAI